MAGTGGGTEVIKKEASNHNYPVYTKRLEAKAAKGSQTREERGLP